MQYFRWIVTICLLLALTLTVDLLISLYLRESSPRDAIILQLWDHPNGKHPSEKKPDKKMMALRDNSSRKELRDSLDNPNAQVRIRVLNSFENDFSLRATQLIMDRAVHDPSSQVRTQAVRLLAYRPLDLITPVVLNCLSDTSENVQDESLLILTHHQQIRWVPQIIEISKELGLTYGQLKALGKLGTDEGLNFCAEILLDNNRFSAAAASILYPHGEDALKAIKRVLPVNPTESQFENLSGFFTFCADDFCFEFIQNLLENPDIRLRLAGVKCLGKTSSNAAVPLLRLAFFSNTDPDIQMAVLNGLMNIVSMESLNLLLEIQKSHSSIPADHLKHEIQKMSRSVDMVTR